MSKKLVVSSVLSHGKLAICLGIGEAGVWVTIAAVILRMLLVVRLSFVSEPSMPEMALVLNFEGYDLRRLSNHFDTGIIS